MTPLDKMLFSLICVLCDNEKGECIVGNKDLADDLGVKPNTIQTSLRRLEEENYIMRRLNIIIDKNGKERRVPSSYDYEGKPIRPIIIHHTHKVWYKMYTSKSEYSDDPSKYKKRT